MQRRDFLKYSAALASFPAVSSILAQENKEAFMIYGAPALPSMVIGVASLMGQLAKQEKIIVKTWRSVDQLRAGVANGSFKVMMSPSNVGVNLRNQGQNVGMVNILTNGIIQLICKNTPINQPEELVAKRMIIPFKNDMMDIVLQVLLKKLKIDINKIQLTYTATPAEAVELFLNKDFDALLVPEPMGAVSILRGKMMGVNVVRGFNVTEMWGHAFHSKATIPQAGIIANVDFYQMNQEKFTLFHEDLINALSWVKANPQSAAEIGKNYMPAPVPAIVQSIPFANLTVTKGSEIKEEIMQFYEELMRFNPRLLGGKLPDEGFFLQ